MNRLIKDLENHDRNLNKEELYLVRKLQDELTQLIKDLDDLKKTLKELESINLYEILKTDLPRDKELEVLKRVFDEYGEITKRMVSIAKHLIDLKIRIDSELI
ncbi:MAG TPA: hypothetical protein EYH22_00275 [Candidatus Nanopusillus sp.]|nr:hypothetical protein [Candidatus Nanopusillus sp.]